jgi:hypothetical protein
VKIRVMPTFCANNPDRIGLPQFLLIFPHRGPF